MPRVAVSSCVHAPHDHMHTLPTWRTTGPGPVEERASLPTWMDKRDGEVVAEERRRAPASPRGWAGQAVYRKTDSCMWCVEPCRAHPTESGTPSIYGCGSWPHAALLATILIQPCSPARKRRPRMRNVLVELYVDPVHFLTLLCVSACTLSFSIKKRKKKNKHWCHVVACGIRESKLRRENKKKVLPAGFLTNGIDG